MIIALTGPSKCGKDTAARYLCEAWRDAVMPLRERPLDREWNEYYATATTLALADPLRDATDALGIPADLTRERKDEPHPLFNGETGRDFLLGLGRMTRARMGEDYFARHGVERAIDAESLCEGRLVIVTDVRREIEAVVLMNAGARLLFVDRDIDPMTDALFGPEWPAIERLRPATLSNRGGLAELTIACHAVVEALRAEARSHD